MTDISMRFTDDDDHILLQRFADYVRPYPEKVLARTIGCTERTAKHFRNATSWPTARHWRLIVRAFGRDVLAAVFEPELNDTLARLNRERRQLEERLDDIRKRARQVRGGLAGPDERALEALDREAVDADQLALFEERA
jgi:hypothetical protein